MNRSTQRGAAFSRVLVCLLFLAVAGGLVAWKFGLAGRARPVKPAAAMNSGKNYLNAGDVPRAVEAFAKAVEADPSSAEAHLNLANALLQAGKAEEALRSSQRALELDPKLIAAQYVSGCAQLRLRQFGPALMALQTVHDADVSVAAVSFLIGRTQQELGHLEEAATSYREAIALQKDHPVAYYALSQVLARQGQQDQANQALERHREVLAGKAGTTDVAALERCKYTQPKVPIELEPPALMGVPVTFADATRAMLGEGPLYRGPAAVVDLQHTGSPDLFVMEARGGFRLLANSNGVFTPFGQTLPALGTGKFAKCLVADLNHDKVEDILMLGPEGSQVFRGATNRVLRDVTRSTGLTNLPAIDGALVDLDFTGKLDLFTIGAGTNGVRFHRNLGNWYFSDRTATSGVPAGVSGFRQVLVDDWNGDDMADLWLLRPGEAPKLLSKQRGGGLVAAEKAPKWPAADQGATGDLNNDLLPDWVSVAGGVLTISYQAVPNPVTIQTGMKSVGGVLLLDYDNDGWLDIFLWGETLRVWRNRGPAGFVETSAELGLPGLVKGGVESVACADLDGDGDTDLAISLDGRGLVILRNDGGNANSQLKMRLVGNRSNASGLGMQIELATGGWRARRTVQRLPVEIGVGKHTQLESVTVRWFDLSQNIVDVKVDSNAVLPVDEWQLPTGSCPFLYAWDGKRFRFVTDILGAAPVGLRMSDDRFIPADAEELVWIGDEAQFPAKDGKHVLQITSELREVLYLDEARLLVVDHPAGTEVHPLDKLVPGPPFPATGFMVLHRPHPLREARRLGGEDVTALLARTDGQVVSPPQLRPPQLRGLAEPHGVVLDFGALDEKGPLVLALTGWLRFGGGMANVGASHNPDLPFPFPMLEVENAAGKWEPVDVVVGAPCGKTKTILVDLTSRLPAGARRLKLSTAFEIHWDRIALLEKAPESLARQTWVRPASTDLHWRGYSVYEDRPWYEPLTPDYGRVVQKPAWRMAVTGWCTRYGPVDDLLARRDEAFVLVNGGDELTLSFDSGSLPGREGGQVREFFLYTDGWEKDADFHVQLGNQVEPWPWHGMDDQRYGVEIRPAFSSDGWAQRYNTRWVAPLALDRARPSAGSSRTP